jgi:hypothetical protein
VKYNLSGLGELMIGSAATGQQVVGARGDLVLPAM